ncbi:phage tail protein [Ammoniphilus resinae]|uniref:Phage tail-like protein n=1 Tax=Ammoniphilus resinae TaxID=861532 RepID=A0ABS4GPR6_9BACL|nr:phage tail protein [Ammoniphilus resinae]MBP1932259.1 phage tail-like protein [Ammoniphilus resinae]
MSEPKFFSFRQPPDWRRGRQYQLKATKGGLTVVQEHVYRHRRRHPLVYSGLAQPVIDLVADRDGRWFMLDQQGNIWRTDLSSGHVESLRFSSQTDASKPTRMAATSDSLIVLQSNEEVVLQSMSSDRAQIKWMTNEWNGQVFEGFALAAEPKDGVIVLAKFKEEETLQFLRFDASGLATGVIPLPFLEKAGASSINADRFEISLGSSDHGWFLDREQQLIIQIHLPTNTATLVSVPSHSGFVAICGAGPDSFWGLIHNAQESPSHSLVHIHTDGRMIERGHVGNGQGTRLIAGREVLYLWDPWESCVHTIQPILETAVWRPFGRRLGVWMSDSLDSGTPETEWHKIVLDSYRENDTQINIRYFASEDKEIVLHHERVNLDSYIADPTIAPETKLTALSSLWLKPLRDPHDALLLEAKGRYLWIYMELIGSEQHAPIIQSLEVHFPRNSYLEYLPSIYQRHEQTRDFLARYLSIFQTMLEETNQKIHWTTRSLDANRASGPTLRWLLGWLGIQAEDSWTEEQLRKLLKQAPTIYNLRGTRYAMEALISIYTGERPIILEYDQVKPLKENPELGEVADRLYAADPYVFNVLVKPEHADTEMKRVVLQQLIDASKPVFTTGKLIILQPWVYMDLHSYLGMNTVLSEPTLLTMDGRSSMPHHTITIDIGQDNRVDQHTRLGLDSRLE